MRKLIEKISNFLKRKRENTEPNIVINIHEGGVSEETKMAVIKEIENFLKDSRGRKLIQLIGR